MAGVSFLFDVEEDERDFDIGNEEEKSVGGVRS